MKAASCELEVGNRCEEFYQINKQVVLERVKQDDVNVLFRAVHDALDTFVSRTDALGAHNINHSEALVLCKVSMHGL